MSYSDEDAGNDGTQNEKEAIEPLASKIKLRGTYRGDRLPEISLDNPPVLLPNSLRRASG